MTQAERKSIMYARGRADALALQGKALGMTGTELYAAGEKIPTFAAAVAMLALLTIKIQGVI